MAPEIEAAKPQSEQGQKQQGLGCAAYVLGAIIAVVGCVLLSFGQLPALVLLVLAAGIILYGHRELKKAKSTMPSAR
jgi:hypothetical protein